MEKTLFLNQSQNKDKDESLITVNKIITTKTSSK